MSASAALLPSSTLPDGDTKIIRPVGQLLLDRLKRMGITAWHEPLLCLPKCYIDYSRASTLQEAIPQDNTLASPTLFSLVISERPVIVQTPRKMLHFTATDGMYSVRITIFIVPGKDIPSWKERPVGSRINILGTLHSWNRQLQITEPRLVPDDLMGKLIPVYEKRRGVVADGAIFDATRYALKHHLDKTVTHLASTFVGMTEAQVITNARLSTTSLHALITALHEPANIEEAELAMEETRRLAAFSIIENARRLKCREAKPESVVKIPGEILSALAAKIPYTLTGDQRRTLREIVLDLALPYPMRRVVSGDVGCGKTLTFMIPALGVQRMGLRAVVLTPNSLLVDQFIREVRSIYGPDAPVVAVTATTKTLSFEGNPVLVGTTALINRLKGEAPPALLVVDEQQKFSVAQKQSIARINTNFLECTATPIPRTTALITHGAMDVSIIREMPVVKNIVTKIVSVSEAARLYSHTQRVIEGGGQVAIVYPIVDDPEKEKKSVTAAFDIWNKKFPGLVGMIHGGMRESEKLAAIALLKDGSNKIAVVSTVIEIGLTLPDLKSVICVNAERYGTSTLHQLRGRVARMGGTGYFFLFLPESVSDKTLQRLQLLERFHDGFALSEYDAQIRGYGDLFEDAERQHGNSRSTVFFCADLRPEDLHQFAGY